MKKMTIYIALCALAGFFWLGCGASSPTTPAQIPTTIEYAGGAVSGAISVQMGKTLTFNVLDASGGAVTDPSITVELLTVSASTDIAVPDESAGLEGPMADTVVTDGSCGTTAISGSTITYTAPNNWPATMKCKMRGVYEGSTLTGQFDELISLEPTISATNLTFATSNILSKASVADLAIDNSGNLYACYRTLDGSWGVNFTKSTDRGATWSTPVSLATGTKDYSCGIAVSTDGTKVAVAWRHDGTRDVDGASERLSYSSDAGATFGSYMTVISLPEANTTPGVVIDTNGVAHVASSVGNNKFITACTSSSCGSNTQVTSGTADSSKNPSLAVSSSGKIYMVWLDTSYNATYKDAFVSQITYSGGSYTVGTNTRVTDSTGQDMYVLFTAVTVNRDDTPVITWTYMNSAATKSYIYAATWNPTTGAVGTAVLASDVDPLIIPAISAPFVSYDNYVHVLYISYGAGYNDGKIWHTMQNSSGAFTTSKEVAITGFYYQRTALNLDTDLAGRPYVIYDYPVYVSGSLTDSNLYLAVGAIQ